MKKEDSVVGSSEEAGSEVVANQHLTHCPYGDEPGESEPSDRRKEILKALEAVERDSATIAESYSSLFASLRSTLSQATGSTIDHMKCFTDATGRLQERVLDASTKGNRYINSY
ncbi:hypothetical protein CASFOL_002365 [Castilleja foliolosa]|uniref:BLOC-1-related complex subunit 6 C-terminal helix domain-containing protein n=1 Tax=Castilleja foliolosa TaxID=1961234 RepID=A0ABD3EI14_9LAMI